MVGLGDLDGGDFYSVARGVSANGSVVVGDSTSASGTEAFRWTSEDGMQSVASILTAAGVDLTGWTLSIAYGVSADGYTIVGSGTNPDGNTEAWIATLNTFFDVPPGYWAIPHIETLVRNGITNGCGPNIYCPENPVTRDQMAVFLERGMRGGDFQPELGAGNVFLDVPASYWAGGWIELLYMDGITTGCGNFNYCPEHSTTRAETAVFLLRAKHGQDYAPPTPTGIFNDVDLNHWAAPWIEQLANEGITSGCGNANYCPNDPVTRAQMAVFLVRTFDLYVYLK
jgi:probable HAF family extracellular repeat protein